MIRNAEHDCQPFDMQICRWKLKQLSLSQIVCESRRGRNKRKTEELNMKNFHRLAHIGERLAMAHEEA